VPVSSSEEEDTDGIEKQDGHDSKEEHAHVREEDGREQDHWNANGDEANEVHSDSRSPMLDTIDKLTEPTVCSLLDGTVVLVLAKVFPFSTGAGWVCCGATYFCVGQYESIPSVCTN
jgi:hypothetical protein